MEKYSALADPGIRKELDAAKLKFSPNQQRDIDTEAAYFRREGNRIIEAHCRAQGTFTRTLSAVDASIWAVAARMKGSIATDEWPLGFAANVVEADDDGNTVKVLTSVHILHLLESAGELSQQQRWNTMRQWRMENELLHRDADAEYQQLFGEGPPNAQSRPK